MQYFCLATKEGQIVNYSKSMKKFYWVEIIPSNETTCNVAGALEEAYENGECYVHYIEDMNELHPISRVKNFYSLGWKETDLTD